MRRVQFLVAAKTVGGLQLFYCPEYINTNTTFAAIGQCEVLGFGATLGWHLEHDAFSPQGVAAGEAEQAQGSRESEP
ncbi:hypothetical protein GCM10007907_27750 [Chitinimonas prasina]|uniref:Uncharacterized protein n=1 Tax=Chitinimonas prasina TaxID=1434937 RepID=A0ABQ5YG62_9NEIS|nr:hypothetical protein GCM10007907_27750 [Chitinimonas prasina]